MASRTLYPPIVDSYMPAFETQKGDRNYCEIYFRLSKFNSPSDFKNLHVTVVKQNTNMNVVKKTDDENKYRSTGIILNVPFEKVKTKNATDDLYVLKILGSDLSSVADEFQGWIPDWTYKIQIRLSAVEYSPESGIGQAQWLNANASNFSEWSTICVIKAINHITYTIGALDVNTANENDSSDNQKLVTLYSSTLIVAGRFDHCGSEEIYKYNFVLYNSDDEIIENSGDIYASQFQDNKSFNYLFKTELQNAHEYKLEFKFETINHFIGGAYKTTGTDGEPIDKRYNFIASVADIGQIGARVLTAENDPDGILVFKPTDTEEERKNKTSLHQEEEDGRIGLKLYTAGGEIFSGNLCVRRADSRDNFKTWTEIKVFILKAQEINDLPIFYDYTAESGVWYKYGVQKAEKQGSLENDIVYGTMNITPNLVMRNYNYSYLLGQNDQQLKLMFDNTMGSFKIQIQESKVDPIGAIYPTVTRNAATRYRVFPVNGLISFWMDENETFCNKKVIYEYNDIIEEYEKYNENNNIVQYDYIYEKDFRKMVLDFLYDGEVKLFKSPTEGNIIVRLTDINCTPNQSLDRMIYSFTSTAHEIAEPTMENYLFYNFYNPGKYGSDFSVLETKIGQIQGDFKVGTDIIAEIRAKYDGAGRNIGGYSKVLQSIHHIKITFEGLPLRVYSGGLSDNGIVLGNNFRVRQKEALTFTSYAAVQRIYEFDERITFSAYDGLDLLGDIEGKVQTIPVTVDFLYDLSTEVYRDKQIQERTVKSGIGQIFQECKPGESIYNEIYYKYYIEGTTTFRKLNTISSIEIEANPGTVFYIQDEYENYEKIDGENHVVGDTGQLRFENLGNIYKIRYVGIMQPDGSIDTTTKADVLINYQYVLTKGSYKVIT